MPRLIVRWSFDGEVANATGNAIRKRLEERGADRIGTGAFELEDHLYEVLDALHEITNMVGNPTGGGHLDHLWVYIDHT